MKPTVYIETSIISYLTARQSNDLRSMANKNATIEWWETQNPKFELVISEFVIAEAIDGIMELQATQAVRTLGQALISRHALPENAEIDAYHVAIAAVNGIEYLLTWNCTHIANAVTRPKIEATCRALGFEPATICTPDELMET